jgi:catechol 2,3-dioxygenase-like lactoylglutathione lyase family enzyme
MLSTPGAALSIFAEAGMERMAPGSMQDSGCGRYTLEFEVEDVDKEFARLKALDVIFVKPPSTQTWGRCSVWFRDPDGNIINFFVSVDS